MKFECPTCKAWRHVEEEWDEDGNEIPDHCWECGTLVPQNDEEAPAPKDWRLFCFHHEALRKA
jgi:uncharacterized Zn finger protein